MGIFQRVMMGKDDGNSKIAENMVYGLTPLGKSKATDYSGTGALGDVLAVLNEEGASSVKEISQSARKSPGQVRIILRDMVRSGYARRVSANEPS